MRALLALLVFLSFTISAHAAQKLFTLGPQNNLHLLNPEQELKTVQDYANVYFKNCVASNEDPGIQEYIETQCACTAAKMQEVMTYDQMVQLFDPLARDSYPYTRMTALAYMPCIDTSVRDYLYDDCLDNAKSNGIYNKDLVCGCMSEKVANSLSKYGAPRLPGYNALGFDLSAVVDNPFTYLITNRSFKEARSAYGAECMATKERR